MTRLFIVLSMFAMLVTLASDIGITKSHPPRWIQRLKDKSIFPGLGLAGIQFGDRVTKVRSTIGAPSSSRPAYSMNGEFVSTVWNYEWQGRMLILSFDAAGQLYGIRLTDNTFNADNMLTIRGSQIAPGSSVFDLMRAQSQPKSIDSHLTCPHEMSDGLAYNWEYPGITYCVCGNNKVYWIDITR